MKILILAAIVSAAIVPAVLSLQCNAETRPGTQHLGSIMDPDDASITELPDPENSKKKIDMLDQDFPQLPEVLRWDIALASKSFRVSDNLRSRSDLITSLSKAIEYLCLGDLQRTLMHESAPTDPDCLKLLDALSRLDPENPIALCTKAGIDAEACKNAYLTQETVQELPKGLLEKYSESRDEKFDQYAFQNDLSVKLENDKVEKPLRDIRDKLNRLPADKKLDAKAKPVMPDKATLMNQYLQISCTHYRLVTLPKSVVLVNSIATPATTTRSNRIDRNKNSLEDLLAKGPFNSARATVRPELPRNHFRLVSKDCLASIEFIRKIDPSFPAIACRRDGITSPSCISARRALQASKKGAAGPVSNGPKNSDGIERF